MLNHPTQEDLLKKEISQLKLQVRQLKTQLLSAEAAVKIKKGVEQHSVVSITDANGVIIYVNNRFCQLSGYSRAELLGSTHRLLRSDEHDDAFYAELWGTIARGDNWQGIVKNRARDGSCFWIEMSITPILHPSGKVHQFVAISNDMTRFKTAQSRVQELLEDARDTNEELKASEEELRQTLEHVIEVNDKVRESEEKYRLVSESMSDLVCLQDLAGYYTYVSLSADALLGFAPEELVRRKAHQRVHPDDAEKVRLFVRAACEGRTDGLPYIHLRKKHRNGHYIWFEMIARPILDEEGRTVSIHTTCRDISRRKAAEQERDNFFNHSLDLMVIARLDGRMLRFNHSWQQTLGFAEAELAGRSLLDFVHPRDLEATGQYFRDQLAAGQSVIRTENRYRCRDGSYKWLSWNFVVFAAEGVMYGFARDFTERKLAEEALQNTLEELKQRNQELDHYVYKVSHDLRSPLCSIRGLLNLAEYETEASAILVYNRMIGDQIKRSDEFIQSILNHSKMLNSADNRQEIDFDAVIRQGFEDAQHARGYARLQRRVRFDQGAPFYSDPFRISLILRNFISNAIKYQNPEAETSYVQFDIAVDAHQARITITDNGIGVEERFVPHLFDMFFRATETAEGSGLGLYIVKQAVQRIGGFIAVTSRLGAGTEFVITLPNQVPADDLLKST